MGEDLVLRYDDLIERLRMLFRELQALRKQNRGLRIEVNEHRSRLNDVTSKREELLDQVAVLSAYLEVQIRSNNDILLHIKRDDSIGERPEAVNERQYQQVDHHAMEVFTKLPDVLSFRNSLTTD